MARSLTSLAVGWALAGGLAAGVCGCASGPGVRQRAYESGAQAKTTDNVRLELTRATYRARALTLEIVITNLGTTALQVQRAGILLAEGGVELPVENRAELPIADTLEVPAGGKLALEIPFASAATDGAVLRLRALSRNSAVDVVDLQIPAPPPPQDA